MLLGGKGCVGSVITTTAPPPPRYHPLPTCSAAVLWQAYDITRAHTTHTTQVSVGKRVGWGAGPVVVRGERKWPLNLSLSLSLPMRSCPVADIGYHVSIHDLGGPGVGGQGEEGGCTGG